MKRNKKHDGHFIEKGKEEEKKEILREKKGKIDKGDMGKGENKYIYIYIKGGRGESRLGTVFRLVTRLDLLFHPSKPSIRLFTLTALDAF